MVSKKKKKIYPLNPRSPFATFTEYKNDILHISFSFIVFNNIKLQPTSDRRERDPLNIDTWLSVGGKGKPLKHKGGHPWLT